MKNYQNIVVGGTRYGKRSRRGSAFFNEGKWEHFIEPLLPDDCSTMTFLDFGCNYGMYIKLAKERGFETVLGIEGNEDLREVTDDYLGEEGQVRYATVDQEIFRNTFVADLPAADFVLMANFHYHVYTSAFTQLINLLRHKTRYVIVVSVEAARHKLYRAESGIQAVRRYFRTWTEADCISGIPTDGDPSPREGMYSVLFKTDVERVPIKDIPWGKYGKRFYRKVKRDTRRFEQNYPMTYPCLLRQDGSVTDGHHRLAAREIEGVTTILAEKA